MFFWRNGGELLLLCRRKIQFGSGGPLRGSCYCSDSVCLPDYLKVTFISKSQQKDFILFGSFFFALSRRKLHSDTVEAFHHLTMASFFKALAKNRSFKSKTFKAPKELIPVQK